jgi:hypothetical protein
MLATATVREIDRLLKKGEMSQRKIAAQLGVSRGVVGAIASGRRGLFGRDPSDDHSAAHRATSPPMRCPHCGYRIYQPCLICRGRQHRERQHVLRLLAPSDRHGSA